RPFDHLAHHRLAEAASAVLRQEVDVGEVDEGHAVRRGAAEADLPVAVVQADDARRFGDQPVLRPACAAPRPVADVAQEAMHLGAVDRVSRGVELEPTPEVALHASSRSRAIRPLSTRYTATWRTGSPRPVTRSSCTTNVPTSMRDSGSTWRSGHAESIAAYR